MAAVDILSAVTTIRRVAECDRKVIEWDFGQFNIGLDAEPDQNLVIVDP